MMNENKKKMIFSIAVFLAVVGLLVYITINDNGRPADEAQTTNTNMQKIEGLKIEVLKEGNGRVAEVGDTVAVNYTGKLVDGTVFDSNVDPNFGHVTPFVFTLGNGMVIKGWELGVAGMKEGEKRTLEIAPENAYGEAGAGGVIPPNATISFEVELLQVVSKK